jgi:predicted ATP-grasp superfamily ATP-dependent carboligase
MGNVAIEAIDYLRRALKATKFAEIELDKPVSYDAVVVEGGIAKFPPPIKNVFYYTKSPDTIIFEGDAQLSGEAGGEVMDAILDMAEQQRVSKILTGAAFPILISHAEPSTVYGAVNKRLSKAFLSQHRLKLMEDGHISGLNGLLLGYAEKRGIGAACLLATMPQYATALGNPKASRAIVEVLAQILGAAVDFHELDEYIREVEERMSVIENKVKEAFSSEEKEERRREEPEPKKKVPEYIIQKIEKLFQDTKKDRSKAVILKKELDRWDLYQMYEDRFLNLFKDNKDSQ